MSHLITIVLFLLLLSVIVVLHEFGHLITAKIFGVYCREFSFGMGPKLWSKQGKETEYSIRAIPFGGFVAMAGDADNSLETEVDTTNIPYERTLPGIAAWKRVIVMLAGIMMNFLLAILIMSLVLLHTGAYSLSPDATLGDVVKGSAADKAGLRAGDRILSASFENGSREEPDTFYELSVFLSTYDGVGKWYFEVDREGEVLNISVMPEVDETEGRYMIGIISGNYTPVTITPLNCVKYAVIHLFMTSKLIITSLLGLFRGIGLQNLSGPIGIYNTTAEAVTLGPSYYFELMALISLNVGIFNALPLPILDGGRVLLTIIEMIIRRPIPEKVQNLIMGLSVALIGLLFVLATFQDILRIFR
ncbi:MAG: site-2 protease family protein [Erysipelotrichaceae bacterium]|nr:site-2 protease family protein [Erysipelotrichaceae bacterium]